MTVEKAGGVEVKRRICWAGLLTENEIVSVQDSPVLCVRKRTVSFLVFEHFRYFRGQISISHNDSIPDLGFTVREPARNRGDFFN